MTIILKFDRHFGQTCQIDETVEYYLVQVHFQVILARQAADLNFNITNPHFISFKFIQREEAKCVVQKLETLSQKRDGGKLKNPDKNFDILEIYFRNLQFTLNIHILPPI